MILTKILLSLLRGVETGEGLTLSGSRSSRNFKPMREAENPTQQHLQSSVLLYPTRPLIEDLLHGTRPQELQGQVPRRQPPRPQGVRDRERAASDLMYVSFMDRDKDMIPYPRMG